MGSKRKGRQMDYEEPVMDRGRSDRWEAKRRRFADEDRRGSRPHGATFYVTIGAVLLAVLFIGFTSFRTSNASTAGGTATGSSGAIQQVAATTASTDAGKVGITVAEVQQKKLVSWDYKNPSNGKTTPLIAYLTPSGTVKIAIRVCEPCNGYSFRVEGNQIVCNTCGTRWDLETSRGVSGGCQGYPPEVLKTVTADGKITVDESTVSNWKPRV